MDIELHKQVTTTPKIRAQIQTVLSSTMHSELPRPFSVSHASIRRLAVP